MKNPPTGKIATPTTRKELLAILANCPNARMVAGATDWMPAIRSVRNETETIVDLSGIGEMKNVEIDGSTLVVGACATMCSLATSEEVALHASALSVAVSLVGSPQIRSRATVGGNAAGASPAADTPVALAALGARAVIASTRAIRELPVQEIPVAIGRNALSPDEAILEFRIPSGAGAASSFAKLGTRHGVSIARVNLGVFLSGHLARVFIGTLGPRPVESADAATALISGDVNAFLQALTETVDRSIPGRHSQGYKRRAIVALGEDVLRRLYR